MSFTYVDEDSVDEELLCNHVCFQPLVDPVVHSSCGNSFCHNCISRAKYKCPLCRNGNQQDFVKMNVRALINQLSKIQVQCSLCNKQMPRGDFEQHRTNCTTCPYRCGMDVSSSELVEHGLVCINVPVPCPATDLGCTEVTLRGEQNNHVQSCRYEQSRWIIQPLNQKYEQLQQENNTLKYDVATLHTKCDSLQYKYTQVLAALHELSKMVQTQEKIVPSIQPTLDESIQYDTQSIDRNCLRDHISFENNIITNANVFIISHMWELIFAKYTMKPNTVTRITFKLHKHVVPQNNQFRIAFGASTEELIHRHGHTSIPSQAFPDHGIYGFAFIVGKNQVSINSNYIGVDVQIKVGDTIKFEVDNGHSSKDLVLLRMWWNEKEVKINTFTVRMALPVKTYRPCIALCSQQAASIEKIERIN